MRRCGAVTPRFYARADSTYAVISGFVKDSASGETIIGATVRVRALKLGAITNKSGFFSLHLPSGERDTWKSLRLVTAP